MRYYVIPGPVRALRRSALRGVQEWLKKSVPSGGGLFFARLSSFFRKSPNFPGFLDLPGPVRFFPRAPRFPGRCPLRSGEFFTVYNALNCQLGFVVRGPAAHILYLISKKAGYPPRLQSASQQTGMNPASPFSALTQQKLCYFVAFALAAINTGAANSEPSFPVCASGSVLQQNTAFVSFVLLPPSLCAGKSILHYKPRFVNWFP